MQTSLWAGQTLQMQTPPGLGRPLQMQTPWVGQIPLDADLLHPGLGQTPLDADPLSPLGLGRSPPRCRPPWGWADPPPDCRYPLDADPHHMQTPPRYMVNKWAVRILLHFYRLQTKLRKGNVFTPVCDSVQGGGVHLPRQTHTPPGRHPPSPHPERATTADCTHPTGIHTCFT